MISQINSSMSLAAEGTGISSASQRHQEMFTKLDTNGDQKIDVVELQAGAPADGRGKDAAAILAEADTNGDGKIDASENEAFLSKMESKGKPSGPPPGPPPAGGAGATENSEDQVYDPRDTNKDGVVSLQELLAAEDDEAADKGIKTLLASLAANAPSYDEKGAGAIDAVGQAIDTVA